jgi:hypothetical protein
MTEKTVVLYPTLGVGHLNPMVQLAKAFLRRGVAVTIAVVDPPGKDPVLEAAVARLAVACPSMTVRLLPIPSACTDKPYSHPAMRMLAELRLATPVLREFLASLPAIDALVIDMFCIDALDVGAEFAIPTYMFYPSAIGDLAIYLQIPDCCRAAPSSFKDMGKTPLHFAGVPPVRALDMPDTMTDRESDLCRTRVQQLARMPEARGILVQ